MGEVGYCGGPVATAHVKLAVILLVAVVGVSGCGESTQRADTATAVDQAHVQKPNPKPVVKHSQRTQTNSSYISCDANIRAKAPNTTCPFAENILWNYWTSRRSRTISVWSPAAHAVLTVTCHEDTTEAVCTTPTKAVVRIAVDAIDNYSQSQADRYAASHDLGPDSGAPPSGSGTPTTPTSNGSTDGCVPGYSPCLKSGIGDYDCAGGSGDGPNYTGPVRVTGSDPFGLDRDGNGIGCQG